MKNTVFIGSTCVDVILNVPKFPNPGMDENVIQQKIIVGGCAFNVSTILRQFNLPYTLCSPIGSGMYADVIRDFFNKHDIPFFVQTPEIQNGCCYCIVESNGRRTFICNHGAEYRFKKEWFLNIDFSNVDYVYFCGLEIEDVDGEKIVAFLEEKKTKDITVFFAPGPRINCIKKELLKRIFALNPILHLNDDEAKSFTNTNTVEDAIKKLYELTNNSMIVTCSQDGAYCYDDKTKQTKLVASTVSVKAIDTTGAGDSHCGTIIASLKQGFSLIEAVERANKIASTVVTQLGSTLEDETFNQVIKNL